MSTLTKLQAGGVGQRVDTRGIAGLVSNKWPGIWKNNYNQLNGNKTSSSSSSVATEKTEDFRHHGRADKTSLRLHHQSMAPAWLLTHTECIALKHSGIEDVL